MISFMGINYSMDIQIKLLETEIGELEELQYELLEEKEWLEKIISSFEELEEVQSEHIGLLENKNEELMLDNKDLTEENEKLRTIRARLTAYSPLDNVDGQQAEGNPNRTSRGYQVGRNIVAVDPKKIPYGTVLEIPGYGIVECQDTGGALRRDNKNIRIDLFMNTYKEAMAFGVKDMDIKILKWGSD